MFLKLQFFYDFEYHLKVEKMQQQLTINKSIQRFRKPIKVAVGEDYLNKNPFMLYKTMFKKKEVVFLSVDKLKTLENHKI